MDGAVFFKVMFFGAVVACSFKMNYAPEQAVAEGLLAVAFAVAGWMPRKGG